MESQSGYRFCASPHDPFWGTLRVGISRSGRSAVVVRRARLELRLVAPAGMRWLRDGNEVLLRRTSDGVDYRATADDLMSYSFFRRVRSAMFASVGAEVMYPGTRGSA